MKRLAASMAASALLALLLASCGGADPTATPRPAATATPAPQATATLPSPGVTATARPTATVPQPTATPTSVGATATPRPTTAPAPAAIPTTVGTNLPVRGGVLKQGDRGGFATNSFQPGIRNARLGPESMWASRLLYQSLFKFDPYNNNVLSGVLVDQWKISDGADQVTLRLAADAKWADGKPVTAQDVKFTFDAFMKPPSGYAVTGGPAQLARSIIKTEAVDERNLRIDLKSPDVSILATLADPSAVIRPAHRTLEQSATDPVGSGAYKVKSIQADVKFVFEKNPIYWMKDARGGALPYLDGIENIVLVDDSRAFSAVLTGQVDALNTAYSEVFLGKKAEIAQRMPNAMLQQKIGGNIGWGLRNAPPFDKVDVRRALSILTDRLAILELDFAGDGVIDGVGVPSESVGGQWSLPTREVLSTPGFRHLDRKTGQLETDMGKLRTGLSSVYEKDPKDIQLAKELLQKAGTDPAKGQFPQLTLTASAPYEARAVIIGQGLKKFAGISSTNDISDLATANAKGAEGRFQAIVFAVYAGTPDEPSLTLRNLTTGNALWNHGFQMPEMDALFDQQKRAVDPAKRKTLVLEMQRKFLETAYLIPGGNTVAPGGIAREWVKNFPMPIATGSNVWDLDRVWIIPR